MQCANSANLNPYIFPAEQLAVASSYISRDNRIGVIITKPGGIATHFIRKNVPEFEASSLSLCSLQKSAKVEWKQLYCS
jgi:hypothetical protein